MATTARLKFLDEAADLLAFTSPTTAAQLRWTHLESSLEDLAKAQNFNNGCICGGCGDCLIAGWNSSIKTKKRTRQERLNQDKKMKSTTLQCSRCNSIIVFERARRVTRVPAQQQHKDPPPATVAQKVERPVQLSSTPIASANETGAKSRSRSKKSSLQSLLADRKAAEPKKGVGLDLMDFMKT